MIHFIVFMTYIKYRYLPVTLNKVDNFLLNHTLQHLYQFFQKRMAGILSKQICHLVDGIEKIIFSSACNILRATSFLLMAFIFAYQVNVIFLEILALWSMCCYFRLIHGNGSYYVVDHESA